MEKRNETPSVVRLPIDHVEPDPSQPRKAFPTEKISELAQSLLGTGQISPITVRPTSQGKYMVVAGERRWRAAQEAGFQYIGCIIRDDLDDQTALDMQLAENYQREDVPPLDQARAFKAYMDKYKISQRELARRTGVPQTTISARLALLSLPVSMHAQIESGTIGPHQALKISKLPSDKQKTIADAVASGRIAGRALEMLPEQIQADPERPIEHVTGEATSAESSPASSSNIRGEDTPNAKVVAPETTDHAEQREDIDLEDKPALAKLLSELRTFRDLAELIGWVRRQVCPYFNEDGLCNSYWAGDADPAKFLGEPVERNGNWYLRPSELLCALCTQDIAFDLDALEIQVKNNPASGLRKKFKCTCGSTEKVAVSVKCTKCGKETWYGWWPPKKS